MGKLEDCDGSDRLINEPLKNNGAAASSSKPQHLHLMALIAHIMDLLDLKICFR